MRIIEQIEPSIPPVQHPCYNTAEVTPLTHLISNVAHTDPLQCERRLDIDPFYYKSHRFRPRAPKGRPFRIKMEKLSVKA